MGTLRMFIMFLVVLCLGISGFILGDPTKDYISFLLDLLVGLLLMMFAVFLLIWTLEAKRES